MFKWRLAICGELIVGKGGLDGVGVGLTFFHLDPSLSPPLPSPPLSSLTPQIFQVFMSGTGVLKESTVTSSMFSETLREHSPGPTVTCHLLGLGLITVTTEAGLKLAHCSSTAFTL